MATSIRGLTKQDGRKIMEVVDEATMAVLGLHDLEAFRFDADVHDVEGFMVLKIKIRPASRM